MLIHELIPDFREYLEHERKLSLQTLSNYISDLRDFQSHLPGTEVDLIQQIHLRAWMREMSKRGLSVSTIHRRIACAGTFFNWLILEKYIDESPCEHLLMPRKSQKQPRYLSEQELKRFVQVMTGSRFAIAWLLMAWLGLRRGEVLRLKWEDVKLAEKTVIIRDTKSKKDRVLPLSDKLIAALEFSRKAHPGEHVLAGADGQPVEPYTIYRAFKRHIKHRGLPVWVKPHTIRHTFATHLVRSGVSITVVKEMMGHSSVQTTMIYIHHSPDILRAAMDKNVLNFDQ